MRFMSSGRLDDLTSKIVWFFLAATLSVLGVLTPPAYPWGSKGHETVASIAENHLTDDAHKTYQRTAAARHDVSRSIDVARQSWPSDPRHGPVSLHQLS